MFVPSCTCYIQSSNICICVDVSEDSRGLVSVAETANKQPSLIKIKGKQENSLFYCSEAPDANEMK